MTRPLRQDAAERREKLLQAAQAAFARDGLDAPLHLIAEHAGVGRATLYRNFADRSGRALAVFLTQIADLAGRTRARLADPHVVTCSLDRMSRLLPDSAAPPSPISDLNHEALAPIRQGLKSAGAEALAVSQAAGRVRPDLSVD